MASSSSLMDAPGPMFQLPELTSLQDSFDVEENAIEYLTQRGLAIIHDYCIQCGEANPRVINKRGKRYLRCRKHGCDFNFSIFKNSFFSNSRLRVNKILEIAYYWLQGLDVKELSTKCAVNKNTILEWTHRLRSLLVHDIHNHEDQELIGGDGVVVEIDESKRTRLPGGNWVIGGVERTKNMRMFAIIVEEQSAQVLRQVLETHLSPGTIVYTDSWKRYEDSDLLTVGLHRDQITREIGFLDPDSGERASFSQICFADLSIRICRHHRTRTFVQGDLLMHIWGRQCQDNHWDNLIAAMCRFKGDQGGNEEGVVETLVQAELVASTVRLFPPGKRRRGAS